MIFNNANTINAANAIRFMQEWLVAGSRFHEVLSFLQQYANILSHFERLVKVMLRKCHNSRLEKHDTVI